MKSQQWVKCKKGILKDPSRERVGRLGAEWCAGEGGGVVMLLPCQELLPSVWTSCSTRVSLWYTSFDKTLRINNWMNVFWVRCVMPHLLGYFFIPSRQYHFYLLHAVLCAPVLFDKITVTLTSFQGKPSLVYACSFSIIYLEYTLLDYVKHMLAL